MSLLGGVLIHCAFAIATMLLRSIDRSRALSFSSGFRDLSRNSIIAIVAYPGLSARTFFVGRFAFTEPGARKAAGLILIIAASTI